MTNLQRLLSRLLGRGELLAIRDLVREVLPGDAPLVDQVRYLVTEVQRHRAFRAQIPNAEALLGIGYGDGEG